MFDFTLFYLISTVCLAVGVAACIFSNPIAGIMETVDEHSNGRVH
ncbi:hypothetical protein DCCM_3150 [Desulfocucumis palustris]|uniref:Uncharacterized protein n=1 Tax=Desulfocucumis palustris TaxID=1898651 RepID=A0A2L2XCH9_9FIRM|nr:hypothetical protein [Desulfocucumis palustris]GBF34039.1 hypothetical protein DCCM_3150 [Desulfocucumis palustris]